MFEFGGLLAVFLLVAANGFFVAAEFSLVAVRRSRVVELVAAGQMNAKALERALDKNKRENQPLELECAIEVARVTADLVHTLFALGLNAPAAPGAVPLVGAAAVAVNGIAIFGPTEAPRDGSRDPVLDEMLDRYSTIELSGDVERTKSAIIAGIHRADLTLIP